MADTYTSGSDFFRKQLSALWVAVGVVVLAAGLVFSWWQNASINPQAVFWGMVSQSMSTPGFTLGESQASAGSGAQGLVQFGFGPTKEARVITTLAQNGAAVKTQTLETPTRSYTQYVSITPSAGAHLNKLAFANALGVWADTSAGNASPDKGLPAIFNQVLLSLPLPFGNLTSAQRSNLLQLIQQSTVYVAGFANVKKQTSGGRLQYVYTVQVEPVAYVRLMQQYADDMGMHELDKVDPESYVSQQATTLTWTVDARARQLVAVKYAGTNESETYSSYGVPIGAAVPAHPISASELDSRLTQAL